ncbi:translation initiation factor IF-2-like [Lemur catta]|uniref:translation initiation factor IF-2-like n=1 Tax=Lemur catta TaxID=9447 RepID=UPI001E26C083|nr:translation initiation factor IF-2-like [Lemur catta]
MDPPGKSTPHAPKLSANQASATPAGRPIRSRNRSPSRRPRSPPGARPEPARPAPPRPGPAPCPAATGAAGCEPGGRRPAARAEHCPKSQKKGEGGWGDSHVAAGGFTTFSFASYNIAKDVKETARPGPEREGAGSVSPYRKSDGLMTSWLAAER